MKCLHVLFSFFHPGMIDHSCLSSRDEISSRQKRVNSKRHFTIDRDDFIPGRVSSRDEISRANALSVCYHTLTSALKTNPLLKVEYNVFALAQNICSNPACINLFTVNNGNNATQYEIYSKLAPQTPRRLRLRRSALFIDHSGQISQLCSSVSIVVCEQVNTV